jgi:hypothetical protein
LPGEPGSGRVQSTLTVSGCARVKNRVTEALDPTKRKTPVPWLTPVASLKVATVRIVSPLASVCTAALPLAEAVALPVPPGIPLGPVPLALAASVVVPLAATVKGVGVSL